MSRRAGAGPDDGGFTLLETMIALGITVAVMASLAFFFVNSGAVLRRQADTQVAVQVAAGAMDHVSQLPGDNVLLGRTEQEVRAQWRAPGVETYLDPGRTELAWQNPALPASPAEPALPTTPERIEVNGETTHYQRWWYVGLCWQPPAGGDCVVVPPEQRDSAVPMFRIVVAVTWPSPDCPESRCEHVAAMLAERTLHDPTWG